MKQYAIIVAGGKGVRAKTALPKQFLELNGLPVLMHTLNAFFAYSPELTVILVLPKDAVPLWNELCTKHNYRKQYVLQHGGASRFQSVKNGLSRIEGEGLVAIHDGVRPLVDTKTIEASFTYAAQHHAAVAAVGLKDSIRFVDSNISRSEDRSKFKLVQTPQTFLVSLIKAAYEMEEEEYLTDDASVAERAGYRVLLFDGTYKNIKITTPEDIIVAEALLKHNT